jgi:hypothetical protein
VKDFCDVVAVTRVGLSFAVMAVPGSSPGTATILEIQST